MERKRRKQEKGEWSGAKWTSFSHDVVTSILAFLTPPDFVSTAAVCQAWRAECKDRGAGWIRWCSAGNIDRVWIRAMQELNLQPSRLFRLRELTFLASAQTFGPGYRLIQYDLNDDLAMGVICSCLPSRKHVTDLNAVPLTARPLSQLLHAEMLPSLTKLRVEMKTLDGVLDGFYNHTREAVANVTSLEVETGGGPYLKILEVFPKLSSLRLIIKNNQSGFRGLGPMPSMQLHTLEVQIRPQFMTRDSPKLFDNICTSYLQLLQTLTISVD